MSELQLAIEYLKARAVSTKGVKLFNHWIAVLPVSEVNSFLEMVEKNEFKAWYDKSKSEFGDVFP